MNKNNIYEVGFLINPDLSQQEATDSVEKIKKILTDSSASVISEGEVVNIELAYQIITKINSKNERFNEAYFSWVKISIKDTQVLEVIKSELDKIKSEIFRYLLIKTVAEDEATNKFLLEKENIENTETKKVIKEIEKSELIDEETEIKTDDLTRIEGIGPKISEVLAENNITTFAQLVDAHDDDIQEMIKEVKGNHQTGTWNEQAELARDEKWEELQKMQDVLDGGVEK